MTAGRRSRVLTATLVIDAGVRGLPPSYFALVMATAAISVAAHLQGLTLLAAVLGRLNLAAYVLLWALVLTRLARHPRAVLADLTDHVRSPGFFTMVAASCTLGSQLLVLDGLVAGATALWVIGTVLWAGLTYAVFTALTIKEDKPSLAKGITGAWLLAVVATQAEAVLSASLAPHLGAVRPQLEFFALSMWLWGGMLYIWMISLIFYRYTFFPLSPSDLTPPYWINMGAMAISTLAGATLLLTSAGSPGLLGALRPFLTGMTVLFWGTGTWWIPMLLTLGVWRYVVRRFPLHYDASYWGAVFPLGMYTLATWRLEQALGLDFLRGVPRVGIYVALAAWAVVFVGMARTLVRGALGAVAEPVEPRPSGP